MQEVESMNKAFDAHEGCHIFGFIDVERIAGNFHISVHAEDYMMLARVGCSAM